MENKFTPEMFKNLKEMISEAKSVDEVLMLAKESGVELSEEKAMELLAKYHKSVEPSNKGPYNAAGCGCTDYIPGGPPCPNCGQPVTGVKLPEWAYYMDCCMNPECSRYGNPIEENLMRDNGK